MIRIVVLMLVVAFFSVYAWKDWFVSLCAAILLVSVILHPDFPNAIGGIPGANPWNVLILSVLLAWATHRNNEGYEWDMPTIASMMLVGFLVIVAIGVIRLLSSKYPFGYSNAYILIDYLVNTAKWVIPSLLLFDGCRTRRRALVGLCVILGFYVLLAIQVVRWIPLGDMVSGVDLASRASKTIQKEIGFNRVTLSMMLAGASWATLTAIPIFKQNLHRVVLLVGAGAIALGQALTGGRTGYVTWIAIGALLASLRWRKLLVVIPVVLVVIAIGLPSVRERMLQGFGGRDGNFKIGISAYEMTSGRDIAWPVVIEQISKSPWIGAGRQGMLTTGVRDQLMDEYGESFPHPHQAYLELLLDNGIFGFLLVIPLFVYVVRHSIPQVMERNDPLVCAIGCTAFCLVLALMIGAFGGQTFYPREGSVGMWAAIGLMLRVLVQSRVAWETGDPLFPDELPEKLCCNTLNENNDSLIVDADSTRRA